MKTKAELPDCPVATTVSLIGSKWKLLILRNLLVRPWRFNELRKSLDGISQKVLALDGGGRYHHPHRLSRSASESRVRPE